MASSPEGGRSVRHVLCILGGGAEHKFVSRDFEFRSLDRPRWPTPRKYCAAFSDGPRVATGQHPTGRFKNPVPVRPLECAEPANMGAWGKFWRPVTFPN